MKLRGYFELYEDAEKFWRWRLRAINRRIVADSAEGYATKQGAERGIFTTIRTIVGFEPKWIAGSSTHGVYYSARWVLIGSARIGVRTIHVHRDH